MGCRSGLCGLGSVEHGSRECGSGGFEHPVEYRSKRSGSGQGEVLGGEALEDMQLCS